MRKSMVILLLAWWLVAPAWGAELPREVRDALPAAAEEITEELEDPASLSEGLSRLWDRALGYVEEAVRQSIGGGVVLLAAAVLCALTEECMAAAGGKVHFVPMAGALAITLAAAGSVKTMMGLGQETVEELNTFSKALLPTLSAAVAARPPSRNSVKGFWMTVRGSSRIRQAPTPYTGHSGSTSRLFRSPRPPVARA